LYSSVSREVVQGRKGSKYGPEVGPLGRSGFPRMVPCISIVSILYGLKLLNSFDAATSGVSPRSFVHKFRTDEEALSVMERASVKVGAVVFSM